jgi:hypothetical protein
MNTENAAKGALKVGKKLWDAIPAQPMTGPKPDPGVHLQIQPAHKYEIVDKYNVVKSTNWPACSLCGEELIGPGGSTLCSPFWEIHVFKVVKLVCKHCYSHLKMREDD